MANNILILHAEDSIEEAEELLFELKLLGIDCLTFQKLSGRSTANLLHSALHELFNSEPAVIVLASQELFADPLLLEWALVAAAEKIMVPVVFGYKNGEIPDWFRNPFVLTTLAGPDSSRDWNRLIHEITRRTFQNFQYTDLPFEPPN
ncbi:MAG: hypothetical protein UW68_C0018G0015 [Candidatus Collierbacteria bacterium GW2011_GWB1_44_6]|uniref:TIR domain-containing protein n=2 Tax=Candidatus Collieribacteriota TaxID=1752725 RepID=A0A0G1JNC9_9BACT|nr:MAG: hypothetical protein UV68_C0039G0006 [Candidatus Collierbacteria bacterium GW2011_GWC2_43_12]KKT73041.1 MAG: hypothetical protein UW68_C0018G0015 [Candidatus Collierbacteria bacterium GW2011_GWB1_44_6]KKT82844.1 MAG: hypothetical protein UW80_C0029G0007 [Microgenomates group bacterium GW2011_GWC1_44_9]